MKVEYTSCDICGNNVLELYQSKCRGWVFPSISYVVKITVKNYITGKKSKLDVCEKCMDMLKDIIQKKIEDLGEHKE